MRVTKTGLLHDARGVRRRAARPRVTERLSLVCLLAFFTLVGVLFSVFVLAMTFGGEVDGAVASSIALLAWSLAGFISVHRHRRDRLLRLLQDGACPACRYVIRALPEQDDGCIVCPECGAAWRHEEPQIDGQQAS